MSATLRPCGGCGRHVRQSEAVCPFCQAAIEPGSSGGAGAPALAPRNRSALMGFAVAPSAVAISTALLAAGCQTTTPDADAGATVDAAADEDAGGPAPLYGGPPEDAGVATDGGATEDAGGPAPAYGGPPIPDAGAPQEDAGGPAPLYGGPPPPPADAGPAEDAGAPGLLYGGPPPA
jgi:hypothetical protein